MNADERQELPQWIQGLIANHPRMVATEEAVEPFIIPGCLWDDDHDDGNPAEVSYDDGLVILRGTPPGSTSPIEARFLLDELAELTVFALCAESDEEE